MAVRIIAIVLAVVNLYLLLSGKFFGEGTPETVENDSIVSAAPASKIQRPATNTKDIEKDNSPTLVSESERKNKVENSEVAATVSITEPIQYKGAYVPGAFFTVANCTSCTSSISGTDGIAIAKIPRKLIENDKEYDFYVYRSDTLLYHKSMRFSDLQFNTYR